MTSIPTEILSKRNRLGLTQKALADLLGLGESGERTIRGWENGEHIPTQSKIKAIRAIKENAPYKFKSRSEKFRFIDLFAGIGGIRLPFQELGGKCVFTSEWDKFSKITYATNFGEVPDGDITKISSSEVPDHEILLGGFPCQTFSQAGLKKGLHDTRGTMFFEIQRILATKKPIAFMLENVKQLKGHNKGRTLNTLLEILRGENHEKIPSDVPMSDEARNALSTKLNYWVDYKVLRAADFGVPQNRERIFLVGFLLPENKLHRKRMIKEFEENWSFPIPPKTKTKVGDILENSQYLDPKYTISDKLLAGHERRKRQHKSKGNGFGYSVFNEESEYTNTISARYYKDGSEILIDQSKLNKNPRKLTPRECARIQGFPEKYIVDAVSSCQAYKQFGNSVAVPVIKEVAKRMIETLEKSRFI